MSLVQILAIWGAASAALFPLPAPAGEWENFKDLKEALVRSSARRDFQLPPWVSNLDYRRDDLFYDVSALIKTEKKTDAPPIASSVPPAPPTPSEPR